MIAAAVCPHPPVLLPEAASGAAGELDELRAACDAAVRRLLAARPDAVLVVGSDVRTVRYGPTARGSFRPYGVDIVVRLGDRDDESVVQDGAPAGDVGFAPVTGDKDRLHADRHADLPLSLGIGAWLLSRAAAADLPRLGQGVATDCPPEECARLGAAFGADDPRRLALLVMGDGSACRDVKAPGYYDPRAVPYDDAVAAALGTADTAALLDLDPVLSTALRVAGRAPWQVLAGAVRASGGAWRGSLDHYAAPYGVAYFVATWEPV